MSVQVLSKSEIEARLASLNQDLVVSWEIEDGKLTKTFTFTNFVNAFGFICKVAICAEKMNHHPEWFNVYKTVKVQLTTHEAKGLSEKDFALAKKMEELAPHPMPS